MAVISNISVGNTTFFEVDDVPTHLASKGDVSIYKDLGRIYINTDGGSTWLKSIVKDYGSMYFVGNTTARDTSQNGWTNLDDITWTVGPSSNFTMAVNGRLGYIGDKSIRVISKFTSTIGAGVNQWLDIEACQGFNNIVPPIYQGGTAIDNQNRVSIACNRVESMVNGQFFNGAVRWTDSEGGLLPLPNRNYIPRQASLTIRKIDEADEIFNEDWESNSFVTNNWTVVNDDTNIWEIGTAENNTPSGSRAVYISDDGGNNATYNITTANVSHFYRDFVIPAGVNSAVLSFDWKSWAENDGGATQYDYGTVVLTNTTTTPSAGSEVSTTQAPTDALGNPTGNGRIGAETNLGKFNHGYGGADNNWRSEIIDLSNFIGQTKRIVFTWLDDSSVGNDPPFVIDNIKLEVF